MKVEEGRRFGMLTAVRPVGRAADKHVVWELLCDCGRHCTRQSNNLHGGRSHSCGCAKPKPSLTHGERYSREYRQWQGAKARCHTTSNKDYAKYGARGIEMCAEWRDSFSTFLADMGRCPPGLTLDRINVNRGYSRENCRWATNTQQQRNKTNGFRVSICGYWFDSLTAAAKYHNVSVTTVNRWCAERGNCWKVPIT